MTLGRLTAALALLALASLWVGALAPVEDTVEPVDTTAPEIFLEASVTVPSLDSPVMVSFYLQHVTSGNVYYYVPSTDVALVQTSDTSRDYRAWVLPEDLDRLTVDYNQMRWAVRVDARDEANTSTIDHLTVQDLTNDWTSTTAGPDFGVQEEVFWVIDTHSGDLPAKEDSLTPLPAVQVY